MKKIILGSLLMMGLFAARFGDDLGKYKVNVPEFKDKILDLAASTTFSGFNYYAPKSMKELGLTLPATEQANMARAVGLFAKSFINSSAFKDEFEKKRNTLKINTDPASAHWREEYTYVYQSQLDETNQNLTAGVFTEEFFASTKQMADALRERLNNPNPYGDTPEGKAQYQTELSIFKQTVEDADAVYALKPLLKSNRTVFAQKYAAIKARADISQKIQQAIEKNREIDAQNNYKANIKAQLKQFLEESNDVDFAAKVSTINGIREFENEAYRQKSFIWKQCYRMGKPATTEFRKIAEVWINEL